MSFIFGILSPLEFNIKLGYRAKDLEDDGDRLKDAVGDFLRYNHDFTDDNRRSISQIIDENAKEY